MYNPIEYNQFILENMNSAREALSKIKRSQKKQQSLIEEHENSLKRFDYGKDLYQPFDQIGFEGKTRIDLIYYDKLFENIDESRRPEIEKALGSLYQSVREIYEFVNIEAEFYGRGIDSTFLNESINNQQKKISEIIYEYVENHFYKLTPEKRKEKYLSEAEDFAKELIKEGQEVDDAIKFSIKRAVMEGFCRRIAFPQPVWYRISALTEDVNYGKVFEQDKLIQLIEDFNKKLFNMSLIVATCI